MPPHRKQVLFFLHTGNVIKAETHSCTECFIRVKTEDVHRIITYFIKYRLSGVYGSRSSLYVQQITNHPTETHRTRLVPFAPQNILEIL